MARVTHNTGFHVSVITRALTILLISVGILATGLYTIVNWLEKQVLTTENWVTLVTPLPKEPVVSDALGTYISKRIFSSVDVEHAIGDVLPPRAVILAAPLTSQLETLTTNASKKIVASDGFQTLWSGANRVAMNRLIAQVNGDTPPLQQRINERFNIDISSVGGQLKERLGSAATAIPALQPASSKAIGLAVDLQAKRERLHAVVRNVYFAAAVLPVLSIAAVLCALALSARRRLTVMHFAAGVIGILLVELIAIKVLRQHVLGQVQDPANLPAVTYIFDAIVVWLRQMIFMALGVAALVLAACSAFGPAKWASSIQAALRLDRIAASRPAQRWLRARAAIRRRQTPVYLAVVALALVYMALVMDLTAQSATNAALATISLIAMARIIATPPAYQAIE
jgi:hypothetical protein